MGSVLLNDQRENTCFQIKKELIKEKLFHLLKELVRIKYGERVVKNSNLPYQCKIL